MLTNREVSIRGGYQPFQLKRDYHLDIFGNTLDKITQQHEKAVEQRAAIQSALANVKLNEAETEWKQNYIDNITKQIDNAAQFGNYSTALTTATRLAGEAASNPELLAKVQENENYETWKKTLDSLYLNNKIDKNTRDYFKAKTKYSFNGTYDDNGNFKTYSLTEYENPVQQIDLSGLFSWVGQTVAEQSGSSQGVGARTATGGKTEYYSPDAAVLSHSGQGYSRKDLATINAVWDEAIKRHPEAIAYLQQQMDVNQWLLDRAERDLENPDLDRNTRIRLEAEADRLRKDLYQDGNESKPYTTQEYLYNSSKNTLKAMSYNRVNTTFNVSGGGSGAGRGAGYGSQGGGFFDLNFNPVNRGPSGLIESAVMKHLNQKVNSGSDISKAIGQE
jgi:hypothetical protein